MKLYTYIGIVYALFVTALSIKLYETNKRLLRENRRIRRDVLEKEGYIESLREDYEELIEEYHALDFERDFWGE